MKKLIVLLFVLLLWALPVRAEDAKGIIIIPSIGLNEPILTIPLINNSWDTSEMKFAGWLEGTTWVDDGWGRSVIIGHTPGAFMNVHLVQVGDRITILSNETPHYYEVFEVLVTTVEDTHWVMPSDVPTLTLITCEGDYRRIVNAYPVE